MLQDLMAAVAALDAAGQAVLDIIDGLLAQLLHRVFSDLRRGVHAEH